MAYNRLRGQYMSALEHAVPERFFNDPSQCNLQGTTTPIAGLPDCPQGISAVKALGIAAAQGQRIYTITQKVYNDNPNIVSNALSAHSWDTQNRVQQSLDAGYEVTIHERPITESGWTGAGYTAIDPTTGAGAYTIEGGANGGWIALAIAGLLLAVGLYFLLLPFFVLFASYLTAVLLVLLGVLQLILAMQLDKNEFRAFLANLAHGEMSAGLAAIWGGPIVGVVLFVLFSYLNVILS